MSFVIVLTLYEGSKVLLIDNSLSLNTFRKFFNGIRHNPIYEGLFPFLDIDLENIYYLFVEKDHLITKGKLSNRLILPFSSESVSFTIGLFVFEDYKDYVICELRVCHEILEHLTTSSLPSKAMSDRTPISEFEKYYKNFQEEPPLFEGEISISPDMWK